MKVIKEGKTEIRSFTCERCGMEFELDLLSTEDVDKYTKLEDCVAYKVIYAICPHCSEEVENLTHSL